jgi:anaerobic dimethyl sulfoxide reductase subunit C (anchor subunit)
MNIREWALILFTLLAQMSVGAFIGLGVIYFFVKRKAGEEQADRFSDRALLAIWPVMGLGLLASLLHLGNPLNAYRAVTNLDTSWLSREILFGLLFAALGFAFAILQWRKIGSPALRNSLAVIAAIFGALLVLSMAMVYMLPTMPSWNTVVTPLSFFTTTLMLGALALGTAFAVNYAYIRKKDPGCEEAQCSLLRGTMRWIAIVTVVLVGVQLVMMPLYVASLAASGTTAALASANLLIGKFGLASALRLILVFVGAAVFGVFLYQKALSPGQEKIMANYAYGAFVLVFVAEILGRFLFYATHVQI